MNKIIKYFIILFLIIIILAIGYFSFAYWSVQTPAVSKEKLDRLMNDMTMEEVKKLLGKPWKEERNDDGTVTWIYGHSLKWYSLEIKFDLNSRITSFVHDD